MRACIIFFSLFSVISFSNLRECEEFSLEFQETVDKKIFETFLDSASNSDVGFCSIDSLCSVQELNGKKTVNMHLWILKETFLGMKTVSTQLSFLQQDDGSYRMMSNNIVNSPFEIVAKYTPDECLCSDTMKLNYVNETSRFEDELNLSAFSLRKREPFRNKRIFCKI